MCDFITRESHRRVKTTRNKAAGKREAWNTSRFPAVDDKSIGQTHRRDVLGRRCVHAVYNNNNMSVCVCVFGPRRWGGASTENLNTREKPSNGRIVFPVSCMLCSSTVTLCLYSVQNVHVMYSNPTSSVVSCVQFVHNGRQRRAS